VKNLDVYGTDSRYSTFEIFFDRKEEYYFLSLPKQVTITPRTEDMIFKVDVKTENRLDLIANKYYKNSRMWWVIAEANKISDPTKVPVGVTLIIPNIASIFGVGGVLG
jgi:hypothetical protein